MEDRELIAHILQRDRHALSVFYRTYTPKLRLFIRSKVGNVDDAEEVLQDALFAFLEGASGCGNRSVACFTRNAATAQAKAM